MANYRVPVLEKFSCQPTVKGRHLSTPPVSPVKGDRYIVGLSATGDWVGKEHNVVTYTGTTWLFDVPVNGWTAYSEYEGKAVLYNGTVWMQLPPASHTASHSPGGADVIKLDDLGTPDDNTDLDASTVKHGLLKKLGGGTTNYLRADGTWAAPPGDAPSVPTGTGFRHITAGAEDAAAKLVTNVDVNAAAAILESKLALNYATHSNANDPTAGQKAALAGTSGVPGDANRYVTNDDPRNTNARTPTAHNHAAADINSGTLDGDRLPALSATKKGGAPATGTPSGKFLKDDNTWAASPGDMLKSVYDTNANNIVDKAEALNDGTNNVTTVQAKEAYDRRASYDTGYECLMFTV